MKVKVRDLLREYIRAVLDPWVAARQGLTASLYGVVQPSDARRQQAACCLVLGDDGTVLAVSRKDDPEAFGLPGGKVDPGETPEEAAARELEEETGLRAISLRQVYVRSDPDGFVVTTFICEVTGEINTLEQGVVRWVTPQQLFNGPFGDYNRSLWARLGLPT